MQERLPICPFHTFSQQPLDSDAKEGIGIDDEARQQLLHIVFREWHEHDHDTQESQKAHELPTEETVNEGGQLQLVVFILSMDRVEDAEN